MEREKERDASLAEASQILLKRTKFHWNPRYGDHWGGYRPRGIMPLIAGISRFIGITPAQAGKIEIVFADNQKSGIPFVNREMFIARCQTKTRLLSSKISGAVVIINRLWEAVEGTDLKNSEPWEKYSSHEIIDTTQPKDPICCEVVTAWENITATTAEELKHAQIYLLAGSTEKADRWEERYVRILTNKGVKVGDVYSADIHEVAASRVVCRILESLATDEERRIFFRKCYEQSLREMSVIYFPVRDPSFYVQTVR